MNVNSSNSAHESNEQHRWQSSDVKSEFISSFVWKKLESNQKVDFIDGVMANNNISSIDWLEWELEKYKTQNEKTFPWIDLSKINIYDLQKAVWNNYMQLNNARELLISSVRKSYNLDASAQNNLLDYLKTSGKTEQELFSIIKSPRKIDTFLEESTLELNKKDIEELFWKLKNIKNDQEVINKIESLSETNREEVLSILSKLASYDVISTDISWLFEHNILSKEQKQELISFYIPSISLQEAKTIGLVTENEANIKKWEILNERFDEISQNFYEGDEEANNILKNEIIENTSLENIIIDPVKLCNRESDLDILADKLWFLNLENDISNLKEKIKQKVKDEWVQSFDDLIFWLKEINTNSRFKDLEKFKEWNIIRIISKDDEWKENISFIKIIWVDDEQKEFKYKMYWKNNTIYSKTTEDDKKTSYTDLLSVLSKKEQTKLECFTEEDIKEQIRSWTLTKSGIDFIDYLEWEDREELIASSAWAIELEIQELEQTIENSDTNTDQLNKLLEQKKNLLEEYNQNNRSDASLCKLVNIKRFLDKIDELDSDWKKVWFEKWIFIETDEWLYEVIWFSDQKIDLQASSWAKELALWFEDFLEAFESQKAKRKARIEDFSSYIKSAKEENKKWDNHEIIDGDLVAKWVERDWKKENKKIEYLVSDDNNHLIKINSIDWNKVNVQYWEREDYSDLTKKEKKDKSIWKDDKWEKVSYSEESFDISLNMLDRHIRNYKLYPRWKTWKEVKPEKVQDLQNEFKGKLSTRIFNRKSVNEFLAWWKMFLEWFKESIKTWNDVHAAQIALALWKILPWELEEDLRIKVESAESDEMDKALKWLGAVDSPIATERIKSWLKNRDTPEYKKEAGILFMLEKYGHLTAKKALYEYRWQWFWYEALGWRVWDALFQEEKEKAEARDITFSEEQLVHILLKKQCKWGGFNWIKRRSRLHKVYEAKWSNWVKDEFEKWYWDATRKRTPEDMVWWGIDEAMWWTTSNALWWFKRAIEKWASLELMSEWFFTLLYSWVLYNVDQKTFTKIQNDIWNQGLPIIMARFATTKSDMILFNKTVLEVTKKMQELEPDRYPWIVKEATALFNDSMVSKWEDSDRIERTRDFWKKYSKPISRALNFVNSDSTEYEKTDKIILLEKENNDIFKSYYDTTRAFASEWMFSKDVMDDACWEVWITWLSVKALSAQYLKINQTRKFADPKTWGRVWAEISKDLNSVQNKRFDDDDEKDRKLKEKYVMHILRDLTSWIFETLSRDYVKSYNDPTSNIWQDFNKWWLNLEKDFTTFSPTTIMDWDADNILRKVAYNIINWVNVTSSYDPFADVSNKSKSSIENIF